jgi:hypothetical protein
VYLQPQKSVVPEKSALETKKVGAEQVVPVPHELEIIA